MNKHQKKEMNPSGQWTWYPRGQYAFGQMGPSFVPQALSSVKPPTIVSRHPNRAAEYRPTAAGFTSNSFVDAFKIKTAVGYKVPEPVVYLNPNLMPLANFSVPVDRDKPTRSINLSEDLYTRTEGLKGMALLMAIMNFLKRNDVYSLNIKEFESVLKACERLSLPEDAQKAGLKPEYDQDITEDDYFKVLVWLLSTRGLDPQVTRGNVRVANGGMIISLKTLGTFPVWRLSTQDRLVYTPVEIRTAEDVKDYKNIVADEEKDIGVVAANAPVAPNFSTGVSGNMSTGPANVDEKDDAAEKLKTLMQSMSAQWAAQTSGDFEARIKPIIDEGRRIEAAKAASENEAESPSYLKPAKRFDRASVLRISPTKSEMEKFKSDPIDDVLNDTRRVGQPALRIFKILQVKPHVADYIQRLERRGLKNNRIIEQLIATSAEAAAEVEKERATKTGKGRKRTRKSIKSKTKAKKKKRR